MLQPQHHSHAGPQSIIVLVEILAGGGVAPCRQAAAAGEADQTVVTEVTYSLHTQSIGGSNDGCGSSCIDGNGPEGDPPFSAASWVQLPTVTSLYASRTTHLRRRQGCL